MRQKITLRLQQCPRTELLYLKCQNTWTKVFPKLMHATGCPNCTQWLSQISTKTSPRTILRHINTVLQSMKLLSIVTKSNSPDILSRRQCQTENEVVTQILWKYQSIESAYVDTGLCCAVIQTQKLKEKLIPVLNLMTESSRAHKETRHYLRQKVMYFLKFHVVKVCQIFLESAS